MATPDSVITKNKAAQAALSDALAKVADAQGEFEQLKQSLPNPDDAIANQTTNGYAVAIDGLQASATAVSIVEGLCEYAQAHG